MRAENGTGVANANSYMTVTDATDYHADRGEDAWPDASATVADRALIRATDYIEATYRAFGEPLTLTQGLQWPRMGDWGVDPRVLRATAMLALEALSGPLMTRAKRGVAAETKSADGAGSISRTYDAAPVDPYPHVTSILSEIASLRVGGSGAVFGGRVNRQ